MTIRVIDGLPIVSLVVTQGSKVLRIENALLDSGAQASLLPFDLLREAGIYPAPNAPMRRMTGVGDGEERVIEIRIDSLQVESAESMPMTVQAGNTDYGYGFDAIVGFDFLKAVEAVVDFGRMEIRSN